MRVCVCLCALVLSKFISLDLNVIPINEIVSFTQDWCNWPDEPFEEMDSTLAVQQYIQQLIKKDPSNIEVILTMPESQDEGVWKYEHLR